MGARFAVTARVRDTILIAACLAAASGCGARTGDGPGDDVDDANPLDPDLQDDSATRCKIDTFGPSGNRLSRINQLQQVEVGAASNGEGCELFVDDVSRGEVDCKYASLDLSGSELGVGRHTVAIAVEDGPTGATECERDIAVVYPGACGSDWDVGLDGTIDRVDHSTFDATGREIEFYADTDNNGMPNYAAVWEYEGDRQVRTKIDENADGVFDLGIVNVFDEKGRVDHYDIDNAFDGSINGRWLVVRGPNGRLRERRDDDDLDGIADRVIEFIFDDAGRLTEARQDDLADGTTNFLQTFTYDEIDQLSSFSEDHGADGTIEATAVVSYGCW